MIRDADTYHSDHQRTVTIPLTAEELAIVRSAVKCYINRVDPVATEEANELYRIIQQVQQSPENSVPLAKTPCDMP